jgi:hypothetical protein
MHDAAVVPATPSRHRATCDRTRMRRFSIDGSVWLFIAGSASFLRGFSFQTARDESPSLAALGFGLLMRHPIGHCTVTPLVAALGFSLAIAHVRLLSAATYLRSIELSGATSDI